MRNRHSCKIFFQAQWNSRETGRGQKQPMENAWRRLICYTSAVQFWLSHNKNALLDAFAPSVSFIVIKQQCLHRHGKLQLRLQEQVTQWSVLYQSINTHRVLKVPLKQCFLIVILEYCIIILEQIKGFCHTIKYTTGWQLDHVRMAGIINTFTKKICSLFGVLCSYETQSHKSINFVFFGYSYTL